jgi:hypothetical protein
MKCLLLQVVSGHPDFVGMVEDNRARHQFYADLHGYDFKVDPWDDDLPQGWSRISAIQKHILSGEYDHILYLDADAAVVNMGMKIEDVCQEWCGIGLCIHNAPYYENPVYHWNTGVIYIRSRVALNVFSPVVNAERWSPNIWCSTMNANEQAWLNSLAQDPHYARYFRTLPYKYNAMAPDMDKGHLDKSDVHAFHGYPGIGARRQKMREHLLNYPFEDYRTGEPIVVPASFFDGTRELRPCHP